MLTGLCHTCSDWSDWKGEKGGGEEEEGGRARGGRRGGQSLARVWREAGGTCLQAALPVAAKRCNSNSGRIEAMEEQADHSAIVAEFSALAGVEPHVAEHYLAAHDWDLEASLNLYFADQDHPPPAPVAYDEPDADLDFQQPMQEAGDDDELRRALAASLGGQGKDARVVMPAGQMVVHAYPAAGGHFPPMQERQRRLRSHPQRTPWPSR